MLKCKELRDWPEVPKCILEREGIPIVLWEVLLMVMGAMAVELLGEVATQVVEADKNREDGN